MAKEIVERPIPADVPPHKLLQNETTTAPPPSIQPGSLTTSFAQREQAEIAEIQAKEKHNAEVRDWGGKMAPMPGGRLESLANLIDHDYVAENHISVFADAHKYLKNPKPGAIYCWPAIEGKAANKTFGMIRRGYYRAVQPDELRDDLDVPFYTHKTPVGEFVCVYDVALCEQPAEVVKKLREFPRQRAILQAAGASAYGNMKGRLEGAAGGRENIRPSMDISTDDGRTVHFED